MKEFFKKLFSSKARGFEDLIHFRIKCKNCDDIVDVWVSKKYDLQQELDSENGGYVLKKEVQDSKCFRIMTLSAKFDRNKNLIEKEIISGEFVEVAEN